MISHDVTHINGLSHSKSEQDLFSEESKQILTKDDAGNSSQRKTTIEGKTFDEERALYGAVDTLVKNCRFEGPADGESALKESSNITLENCDLRLRYPLWHVDHAVIDSCALTEGCRAALWYAQDLLISKSTLGGIKALRECRDVTLDSDTISSQEFGWRSRDMVIHNCSLVSEYPFFECSSMDIDALTMKAKYSLQYVQDVVVRNSHFDTKDALWHSKNVTVYDSVLEGEYLAWYSENLRLVRCHIKGSQPFCYAKGLVLEDCTMEDCDLSFERSEVQATISGRIDSIKNPLAGYIKADSVGEIIMESEIVDPGKTLLKITNPSESISGSAA